MEAIKEKAAYPGDHGFLRGPVDGCESDTISYRAKSQQTRKLAGVDSRLAGSIDRNKRSVWTVAGQGYKGAHFATFPEKLITPMILAGTSEKGACVRCGAPWRRLLEKRKLHRERPNDFVKRTGAEGTGNACPNSAAGVETRTLGWYPTCGCDGLPPVPPEPGRQRGEDAYREWVALVREMLSPTAGLATRPCVVLDPFIGSGTTAAVAVRLGRAGWGIDLSEEYLRKHAVPRVEGILFSVPALRGLVKRENKPVAGEVMEWA